MAIFKNNNRIKIEFYRENTDGTTTLTETKYTHCKWKTQITKYETRFHKAEQSDFTKSMAEASFSNTNLFKRIIDNRKLVTIYYMPYPNASEIPYRIVDFEFFTLVNGGKLLLMEGGYQWTTDS